MLKRRGGFFLSSAEALQFHIQDLGPTSVFDVGIIPLFLQQVMRILLDKEDWEHVLATLHHREEVSDVNFRMLLLFLHCRQPLLTQHHPIQFFQMEVVLQLHVKFKISKQHLTNPSRFFDTVCLVLF